MITIDYLELIEQGVDAWNRWREEHPDENPELESAYLFEKSLQGINFRSANLSRACLIGTNLQGADLTGADLKGVYASSANLQGARLAAANLQDGNFSEANLAQADLSDVVTDNANFTNACLEGTCLDGWPTVAVASTAPVTDGPTETSSAVAPVQPETKSEPTLPMGMMLGAIGVAMPLVIAISSVVLYFVLRPRPPKFVTPDGTVTIQLVCDELDVTPISAREPDHTYQNGIRFYGQFEDGKPANGRGSMLYPNGNRYDGEYRNGQRNGCGTFTFENGRRYVGEFQNDLFSGRGIWILENGDRYIGDFEFNRCNGEGVYMFADGTSKSGIWQQGRLVDGDVTCDSASADSSVRDPIDLPKS